jgi:hypothetical protein
MKRDNMHRTIAAGALTMLLIAGQTAFAADGGNDGAAAAAAASELALATDVDWSLQPVEIGASSSRGPMLSTLYVSFAALQAYDAYSTSVGLRHGAVEANPMMSGIVGSTATLLAVKAAVTTTTFLVSERLWKQHRRGHAVAVMVISNGLMAAVAARNHAVLHEQR